MGIGTNLHTGDIANRPQPLPEGNAGASCGRVTVSADDAGLFGDARSVIHGDEDCCVSTAHRRVVPVDRHGITATHDAFGRGLEFFGLGSLHTEAIGNRRMGIDDPFVTTMWTSQPAVP